jgi:hypothetical protein
LALPPAGPNEVRAPGFELPVDQLGLADPLTLPLLIDTVTKSTLATLVAQGAVDPRLLRVDAYDNLLVHDSALRAIVDGTLVDRTGDFQRAMAVTQRPDDWVYLLGRTVHLDRFEDVMTGGTTTKWQQITGTVGADTTTAHSGGRCLMLTTGAAAGNQAVARKFFRVNADQGFQQGQPLAARLARVIVGAYWRQMDANLREFHIRMVSDDSNRQREWWVIYTRRFTGADTNLFGFFNLGSSRTDVATYPIDSAGNIDNWIDMSMECDYNQGTDAQGGYGFYRSLRLGDFINKRVAGADASVQNATAAAHNVLVDLVATSDGGVCKVAVDDFLLADLSNSNNV